LFLGQLLFAMEGGEIIQIKSPQKKKGIYFEKERIGMTL